MNRFYNSLLSLICLFTFASCIMDEEMPVSSDLGSLEVDAFDFIVDESKQIQVYLSIPSGIEFTDSAAELFLTDNTGEIIQSIGSLKDDGNVTANGDDIAGDRIYSGLFYFSHSQAGEYRLQVVVDDSQGSEKRSTFIPVNIFDELSASEIEEIQDVLNDIEDEVHDMVDDGMTIDQVRSGIISWLTDQNGVAAAKYLKNSTMVEITFENDRSAIIMFTDQDNLIKGGSSERPEPRRKIGPVIQSELSAQFRSVNENAPSNRNVLIYSPHEEEFKDGAAVAEVYNTAECGEYNVTFLKHTEANLAALNTLSEYGTIYITTHGGAGVVLSTGEELKDAHMSDDEFQALWSAKKILPGKEISFSNGDVEVKKDTWVVTYKWFESNLTNLPNSIVFLNACQSTMSPELSESFLEAGASCVFGYSESVHILYGKQWGIKWAEELVDFGMESGDLSVIGEVDLLNDGKLQLKGSGFISYSLEFNNGDFEHALCEWTTSGDGRAVVAVDEVVPYAGSHMGLISTGLGKTLNSGTIKQSFIIDDETTLRVSFNLMSEEFLEYIGSQYQDKFTISIVDIYNNEEVLFHRTIDGIASEYGADEFDPGNLISTSANLGEGGVYMTGWQNLEFPIYQYKNKCITLKFYCEDVGDSAYDTAVLLDEIIIL